MLFPHLIFYSFNKIISVFTDPSELFASEDAEIASLNAVISFVGKVIATDTIGGCRFFTVQVTAFKQMDPDDRGPVYETFRIVCIMGPEARWGRVRFPYVNNYIQVMGNVSFRFYFLYFTNNVYR
jgi:hypothetical protein